MEIQEIKLDTWDRCHELIKELTFYIFRGQAKEEWTLSTSLERAMSNYASQVLGKNFNLITHNNEYWMIHEFKRRLHLYYPHVPEKDDLLQWLSIMQQHGAPTRLLDFTESFYLAVYFAISESTDNAVVWAIDHISLRKRVYDNYKLNYEQTKTLKNVINEHHIKLCNEIINKRKPPLFIIPVEPMKLSERISRQQGLFLMPTCLEHTFMENLDKTFLGQSPEQTNFMGQIVERKYSEVIKIIIPKQFHKEIISDLTRMNITSETLFPGLDGFARSLQQMIIRRY